jgi:sulfane dehydrogenase subunit SoxC
MKNGGARFSPKSASRREALAGAASLMAGVAVGASAAHAESPAADLPPAVPEWQQQPGAEVMSPPYGQPSRFEAGVIRRERTGGSPYPTRQAAVSLTPLQDLHGVITPNGLHYERHHAGVSTIDPAQHRLIIHGLVDRPMILRWSTSCAFPRPRACISSNAPATPICGRPSLASTFLAL